MELRGRIVLTRLTRNPVLPLFAAALGAGPEWIGLAVGISTVTGILFEMSSGVISDIIGPRQGVG